MADCGTLKQEEDLYEGVIKLIGRELDHTSYIEILELSFLLLNPTVAANTKKLCEIDVITLCPK